MSVSGPHYSVGHEVDSTVHGASVKYRSNVLNNARTN